MDEVFQITIIFGTIIHRCRGIKAKRMHTDNILPQQLRQLPEQQKQAKIHPEFFSKS